MSAVQDHDAPYIAPTQHKGSRRQAVGAYRENHRPVIVLVAHNVADDNGTGRVCAELIRHAAQQYDFVVVSAILGNNLRPLVRRWLKVEVPQRPFPLRFGLFWIRAARLVNSQDADIVHAVGAIVGTRVDIASVHHCHAGFVSVERRLGPKSAPMLRRGNTAISRALALVAERWCYRPSRTRTLAAVSDGVRQELLEHYPGVPVHVTTNGVDQTRFRPDPLARNELRQAACLTDEPVAIFVGGDWDHKGLGVTLQALANIRNTGTDLRLWVVGVGDRDRFSESARDLGVETAVWFLGPRSDVERFLAAADMFVFPSTYEACSLVILEAAASGLPIIATRVHGIRELMGAGDSGILVSRDAGSIADAMRRLATDPKLRSRLGKGALARSARYSWQASAASVTDLYCSLLADRAAASA